MLTIRYRNASKRSAKCPGPYYIDGSVGQPALTCTSEPDKRVVSQLTRREKLPRLPLTSHEFVKAFTSDKK